MAKITELVRSALVSDVPGWPWGMTACLLLFSSNGKSLMRQGAVTFTTTVCKWHHQAASQTQKQMRWVLSSLLASVIIHLFVPSLAAVCSGCCFSDAATQSVQ